jgi:hypothetical protein
MEEYLEIIIEIDKLVLGERGPEYSEGKMEM